jgi:signal transduction histidine kinase
MSDEAAGSLRDAWAALTRLSGRLDDLAGAVARFEPASPLPVPPGELLGEPARASLRRLGALLAVGPPRSRDQTLLLALDRLIQGAGADCGVILALTPAGDLSVVGHQGFLSGPPAAPGPAGIIGRALAEQEIVVGGAADHDRDPFLRGHGLGRAVAVPIRLPGEPPAGAILAGWRRPLEIGTETLETLTIVADRLALALGPRAGDTPAAAVPLVVDLDPDRAADLVARAAADLLGNEVLVRVLLAGPDGLRPAGVTPAGAASGVPGVLADCLARGGPWIPRTDTDDASLAEWLGAPPRLIVPLATGPVVIGLLVAGGPRPLDPARLDGLLPAAAAALRNALLHAGTTAALAELRSAGRAEAEPVSPAARDFASLLAVILGRLSRARERVTDAEVAAQLEVAEEAAWRAAEAVRGLLGFAPGHRADALKPLDVRALLEAAAEAARRRGPDRPGEPPLVQLDVEPLPPIRGSVADLREALDHLLDNALEASTPGTPVVIRARWDGGPRIDLVVEDRGAGMDEATRVRAVDPFFSTRGPGRLGLGLPVAQAIVARHRGELEIVSAPGLGTTVRLRLPTVAGARRSGPTRGTDPVTVLVVEDEPAVREALVEVVGQLGYVALTAATAADAQAALEHHAVDVVITDLALPGGSGLEVARRARGVRRSLPVVLVTAWPGRLDPAQVEASGVGAVIEKPVGFAEVRAALATVLDRPGPA